MFQQLLLSSSERLSARCHCGGQLVVIDIMTKLVAAVVTVRRLILFFLDVSVTQVVVQGSAVHASSRVVQQLRITHRAVVLRHLLLRSRRIHVWTSCILRRQYVYAFAGLY